MSEKTAEAKAWRELYDRLHAVALGAIPSLKSYDIKLTIGSGGMPHRVEYPADTPGHVGGEYTFFDERELRRMAVVLGREVQAALQSRADALVAHLDAVKAMVAAQAQAVAEVERGLR